ncbi:MAG: LuxR C-terminal-related transcriptional regulator [Gemmatimonadota bacterium]
MDVPDHHDTQGVNSDRNVGNRIALMDPAASLIESGRAAILRGDWKTAAQSARRSLESGETAEGHELLGLASWWLSDADTLFNSRERAYRLYLDRDDVQRAARIATRLDWDYRAFRAEPAVASGWLRRARRLLEGDHDSAAYGWLLLREADARLSQDAAGAATGAAEAVTLGRRHQDPDLEYLALSLEGLALVAAGSVVEGMQQLDEATAAVVAGEFADRSAAGVTCCHLITACELVRDFDRAGQWCGRVREYCRRWDHPALFAVCRTQYAGVLVSSGNWAAAETELASAVAEIAQFRPGWLSLGYLRLAELRRRQGRLDEAAVLFESLAASAEAELGLGMIALERGVPAEAERLARRVLRQVSRGNHTARASALELIVLAATADGRADAALEELTELEKLAVSVESDAIRGSARLAAAGVAARRGRPTEARTALEEAASLFDRAGAPYDGLRARLMLAEQLQTEGALEAAAAEAAAAAKQARLLGARGLENRATALSRSLRARPGRQASLTAREREVLAHVVRGLTNRQIAGRLGVSQHTIHRHVANVFTKLGLSSRAAAVAFAVRNGLS